MPIRPDSSHGDASDAPLSRRAFTALAVVAGARALVPVSARAALAAPLALPSEAQLAWQREELAMFIHFGINTFTDREWGDGTESLSLFNPEQLDARQWARTAKASGFRAMILTAKHHDGFCLWPTATTRHAVHQTPWRGGNGDVVGDFTTAARAEGLRVGLYLSPWDRNAGVYGEGDRYNDFYCEQLAELLTRYGPITEVWFDGANGEGPNGRKQQYDWSRIWGLVRKLQPSAVMFSDAGPDVRWIGNERGAAGDPNWSTVDPSTVTAPGQWSLAVEKSLQHGDPVGTVWRPGETDMSIRPGWFHHPAEDDKAKSADALLDTYFTSVGRNSKLLLNVPPTRAGLLDAADVARLREFAARRTALFEHDWTAGRRPAWRRTGPRAATLEIDLGEERSVNVVRLEEAIEHGQLVARYTISGAGRDGAWRELIRGETIGYRKLERLPASASRQLRHLRVTINDALRAPRPVRVGAFA